MPPELIVKVVGDTSSLERSFSRAGKSAQTFDRSLTHAARGAAAGSGVFTHLGRSLAFASGGFVAFASAGEFIRSSIDAARDAEVSQRSLGAQLKANGESLAANRAAIEKAGLSLSKFGFTTEDSAKALTVLDRATGNIDRSLKLQAVTADIARAKNIDLAQAALVVGKVFGGQETALRRAVPGLEKNAHGLDLIREAAKKLAGQSAANTTEAQKFHAILHDTEVIIGTALLPTFDRLLKSLGDWLEKMNRTGDLQRDVNQAVKVGTDVFKGLEAIVKPTAQAFQTLGKAVGGTKNEVELLVGAFATFKVAKVLSSVGLIGATAKTSTSQVAGLRGALVKLGGIGTLPLITIPIALELLKNPTIQSGKDSVKAQLGKLGFLLDSLPEVIGLTEKAAGNIVDFVTGGKTKGSAQGTSAFDTILKEIKSLKFQELKPQVPSRISGQTNLPLTPAQQFKVDLAANPDSLKLLREQAARDKAAIAFAARLRAQGRISNKKYIDEVGAYQSDLHSTLDHISSIISAAATAASAAAREAAKRAAAALDKAVPDLVSGGGRFGPGRLSGLPGTVRGSGPGGFGLPRNIGGAGPAGLQSFSPSLLLQLEQAKASATTSTLDDLSVTRKIKAAAEKALASGKLAIQGQIDAWNAIADANDKLRNKVTGDQTKFQHLAGANLIKALGLGDLDRATKRKILAGLSQVGPNGTIPQRTQQFALAGGGTTIVMHNPQFNGITDIRKFEQETDKRARSRAVTRRGAR